MLVGLTVTGCYSKKPDAETAVKLKPATQAIPAKPSLSVSALVLNSGSVEFTVTTNLPTPVAAMASLDLQGQKPNDSAIGTSHNVTLTGRSTTFTLRAVNDDNALDGNPLPEGSYEAEVIVGPKWPENKNIAVLGSNLEAKQRVAIKTGPLKGFGTTKGGSSTMGHAARGC